LKVVTEEAVRMLLFVTALIQPHCDTDAAWTGVAKL